MHTDEKAITGIVHSRFLHGFEVHILPRLAYEWHGRVVAICDTLEEVVDLKKPYNSPSMVDIRICAQPESDFTPIDVLKELAKLWVGLDDVIQRESIINFGIVV